MLQDITSADDLTRDDLLAIVNAHLLSVAPGRIVSMEKAGGTLMVTSLLASPFESHTPSQWMTVLDLTDGHTVSIDVTVQSVKRPEYAAAEAAIARVLPTPGTITRVWVDGDGYGRVVVRRYGPEDYVSWRWATKDTDGQPKVNGAMLWSGRYDIATYDEAERATIDRGATR